MSYQTLFQFILNKSIMSKYMPYKVKRRSGMIKKYSKLSCLPTFKIFLVKSGKYLGEVGYSSGQNSGRKSKESLDHLLLMTGKRRIFLNLTNVQLF